MAHLVGTQGGFHPAVTRGDRCGTLIFGQSGGRFYLVSYNSHMMTAPENVDASPSVALERLSTPVPEFACVALDQGIDRLLDYRIPPHLVAVAAVGRRVQVPLGRRNKIVTGTIVRLDASAPVLHPVKLLSNSDKPPRVAKIRALPQWAKSEEPGLWGDLGQKVPGAGTSVTKDETGELPAALDGPQTTASNTIKPIHQVLTEIEPFSAELMRLAEWISNYYFCPQGQVLAGIMPAAVKRQTRVPTRVTVLLPALEADKIAAVMEKLSTRGRSAYRKVAEALVSGPLEIQKLVKPGGLSRPMLKRFIQMGLLAIKSNSENPADSATDGGETSTLHQRPVTQLTAEQTAVYNDILPLLEKPEFKVRLIHGVTGSGKTELYIRCIEKVVATGRRAIVLVPEISLTQQAAARFTARFERVAVLHSRMKNSLRHQYWQSIASGWAQVIVGARSAVFAPVENLGLIVVDEEHDTSYKQDSAPRYHGRDVAIRRAQLAGVPVLLGSATPSLESWHNAAQNPHYKLLRLTSRPNNVRMPRVVVVNMREEHRQRRGLHAISTTMEFQLKKTLAEKGQAILLLNRRGYAHYLACAKCPWVMMCDHCDATMVVHLNRIIRSGHDALVKCHYCLTSQILPDHCPDCQSRLIQLGQGTQRVEEELARKFPRSCTARMDSDSMRKASDYKQTLEAFGAGELDILLGTQMIAKGLDFPNVRLVGVLNADLAMTSPDFRAAERTFDLVCQVAGRSGRAGAEGTVVVQTMQPDEPAIVHATRHDYPGFVQSELPHRKEFGYPPYGRIVRFIVTHKQADTADATCRQIADYIQDSIVLHKLPVRMNGPQLPAMARIDDEHRREILLFSTAAMPLQQLLATVRGHGLLHKFPGSVVVDVDPYAMA